MLFPRTAAFASAGSRRLLPAPAAGHPETQASALPGVAVPAAAGQLLRASCMRVTALGLCSHALSLGCDKARRGWWAPRVRRLRDFIRVTLVAQGSSGDGTGSVWPQTPNCSQHLSTSHSSLPWHICVSHPVSARSLPPPTSALCPLPCLCSPCCCPLVMRFSGSTWIVTL